MNEKWRSNNEIMAMKNSNDNNDNGVMSQYQY